MKKHFFKLLGPGLIWAGASIGVSHLVQSTRAGALYGFELVIVILIANFLKYPFFEFGPRYAASTGKSILHGYASMGKWAISLYLLVTVSTMFTLLAAVTSVTAGLFSSVFTLPLSPFLWSEAILFVCLIIVVVGKYRLLDNLMKVVIIVLALATVVAVGLVAHHGFNPDATMGQTFDWTSADVLFLIALVGWMPSAIDVSVWHSMWTVAKIKSIHHGHGHNLKFALLDFNIGYIGTAVLSLAFLALGAIVMYGKSNFPDSGVEFSNTLIAMYTKAIGGWSYPLIAFAALATMFSTTLTVLDAYPRVLKESTELLFKRTAKWRNNWILSAAWMLLLFSGTLSVLAFFAGQMKLLVDIATSLSFLVAPILAYLNYNSVMNTDLTGVHKPGPLLRLLALVGIMVLTAFAIYYVGIKLGLVDFQFFQEMTEL